jgi:methylated-DNA-[protein]-cysteine S-methyltransferase
MVKQIQSGAITLYQKTFNHSLGSLLALSSENGLCYLAFQGEEGSSNAKNSNFLSIFLNKHFPRTTIINQSNEALSKTGMWLEAYFAKAFKKLKVPPIDLQGTSFLKQGLNTLLSVPPGQTKSYGQFAKDLGNPLASRAVGRMMNQNPIGLIIPCHRIIGKQGELTGYRGGIDRKRWLLEHEGLTFR